VQREDGCVKLKSMLVPLAVVGAAAMLLFLRARLAKPPEGLGFVAGKFAPCPDKPNCVSSQAPDAGHRIEPLAIPASLQGKPEGAIARVRSLIEADPAARIVQADALYLRAEFTSRIFRFVDDLEIAAEPTSAVLHVRSASRTGRSDLGVNRRRVEQLRGRLAASH